MTRKRSSEKLVRDIKRNTRRKYSSEEKIRIVIEGMRGETSIAELCRREGIAQSLYYRWSKDSMESGRKRLDGDTKHEANTSEVQSLKNENAQLLKLAREDFENNRHINFNQFSEWLRTLKIESEPKSLWCQIYNSGDPGNNPKVMELNPYFKLLEYDELNQARESAKSASKLAIITIIIAGASFMASVVFSVWQIL